MREGNGNCCQQVLHGLPKAAPGMVDDVSTGSRKLLIEIENLLVRRNCAGRHEHCNQLSHAHLSQGKRSHRAARDAIRPLVRHCGSPSTQMIVPAYSMDAAQVVYEARLQASDAGVDAFEPSTARVTSHAIIIAPGVVALRSPQPMKFVDSGVSSSGALSAFEFGASPSKSQAIATAPSAAIALPKPAASRVSSIAINVNPEVRAQIARWAFASGWIFLAIALFCLARSFSVIPAEPQRRWRMARAQP